MATTEQVSIIKVQTSDSEKNIKSLKAEMKDLTKKLQELALAGDQTSDTYKEVAARLGELKKVQREVSQDISEASTTFTNTVQYTAGALAGVSGAVQAVTGALSLMGIEADKDSKMMKILVAAMSITSGLQAIQGGVEAFKLLATNIKRSTIAQQGFNAAVKANPIGLIVTAVAALGAGLFTLIKRHNEAAEAIKRQRSEEGQLDAEIQRVNSTMADSNKIMEKRNELWDAYIQRIRNFNNGEDITKRDEATIKNDLDEIKKQIANAQNELKTATEGTDYYKDIQNRIKVGEQVRKDLEKELESWRRINKKTTTPTTPSSAKIEIKEYDELERRLNEIKLLKAQGYLDERLYTEKLRDIEIDRYKNIKGSLDEVNEKIAGSKKPSQELLNQQVELQKAFDQQKITVAEIQSKLRDMPLEKLGETEIEIPIHLEPMEMELENNLDFVMSWKDRMKLIVGSASEVWESYGGAVSGIISNVQNLLGVMAGDDEKSFEEQKKLKIASATISMLQGAVEAFMQSISTYGIPLGLGIGATNAALVTATGIAQINQIKKTKKGSSGASPSTASTTALSTNYSNVRMTDSLGGLYDFNNLEEKIGNQKVQVSVHEIIDAENQVRVTNQRNRF